MDSSGGDTDTAPATVSCDGLVSAPGDVILELPVDKMALAGIQCVDGDLYALGTVGDLKGLEALQIITGDLVFANEGPLSDSMGLSTLKTIGGSLVVFSDSKIKNFSGLESLNTIGNNLQISTPGLVSLNGLQGVSSIVNNIIIGDNGAPVPSLVSLSALAGLTELAHDILIYGTSIADLDGLQSLKNIGGSLEIVGNHLLPTCLVTAFADKTSPAQIEIKGNLADRCGE